MLKASGELPRVCFESSPMSDNGKFPPNLHVSAWPKGREAHTDVKEEGEERGITFENGVAWERTEQLMATHLTSLQLLSSEEVNLEIKCIFLPVVYPAMSATEWISQQKVIALVLQILQRLFPLKAIKLWWQGVPNVLLARTHTGVSFTQDMQVPLKHVRELQLYLWSAWPLASLGGRERQPEQPGSHM